MGLRSWVHVIYGKDKYNKLLKIEESEEYKGMFFIGDYILIKGKIKLIDRLGGSIGEKEKKTLLVLSHADGFWLVEDLITRGILEDEPTIIPLHNLHPTELNHTSQGTIIQKGTYITKEEFLHHLEKMEFDGEYNIYSSPTRLFQGFYKRKNLKTK